MYSIKNNKLYSNGQSVKFVESPNKNRGIIKPKFLVIHYTAGFSFKSDFNAMASRRNKAAAHLLIGPKGQVGQLGYFNKGLWHAGKSRWKGYNGLNSHSIGIEVTNPGYLKILKNYKGSGETAYQAWNGKIYRDSKETRIVEARHPNGGPKYGWILYNEAQNEAILEIGQLLMEEYDLRECVGHDMIAPKRKVDPGPCFPQQMYNKINGRQDKVVQDKVVVVKTNKDGSVTTESVESDYDYEVYNTKRTGLNIRAWPDSSSRIITTINEGSLVEYQRQKGNWFKVSTEKGIEGWAFSKFLKYIN